MIKKGLILIALISLFLLYACKNEETKDPDDKTVIVLPKEIKAVEGLDDITVKQYDYFNPLKDVIVTNEKDQNISYLFSVSGHVNYGVVGTYELDYELTYGEDVISETRAVTKDTSTIS